MFNHCDCLNLRLRCDYLYSSKQKCLNHVQFLFGLTVVIVMAFAVSALCLKAVIVITYVFADH